MKKLAFLLLILIVGACKDDNSGVGPNRADGFVGVYYTNPVKDNRSSFYVWVVTRKANNRLGIGYYIEDTYKFGNQGTLSKKKEVYFLENVEITADSAFSINESVPVSGSQVRLSGQGRLLKGGDGAARIDVSLEYVGADNKTARTPDQVSFQKVSNVIDEDPKLNDFSYDGTYQTELSEGAKTAFHNWSVSARNNTSFEIDYKIRDKYNQGTIGELINNYILNDAKKVGNRSLAIDMNIQEEASRDKIKIKAVGNKLLRSVGDAPRIAVVVQITNETQGITRMEYLELKKQN
ncbi:hypothetical protein GCM10023091_14430 [Ravibacter arvi]|uniref:Uncharacterized protein n=1 Tax=Ravibacter arvi TaxID=2051041 RepID=A0ABP8LUU3_9BACT